MKLSEFKNKEEKESKKESLNTKKGSDNIQNAYDKYKDLSHDELMSELDKQIAKQKNDGTFNLDELKNSAQKVMPFLNNAQKNNLMSILEKLK